MVYSPHASLPSSLFNYAHDVALLRDDDLAVDFDFSSRPLCEQHSVGDLDIERLGLGYRRPAVADAAAGKLPNYPHSAPTKVAIDDKASSTQLSRSCRRWLPR